MGTGKSQTLSLEHGTTTRYGGKANSKQFFFLRKIPLVSEDLIVIGSGFQIVGTSTEKAHLPIFSLVLGIKSCLKMVDLRVLGMSEKVNFVLTMLHHYAF